MYEIVVGVDANVERALAQTNAIIELPGHEEIQATLVHVIEGDEESVGDVESVAEARAALEEAGVEVRAEGAQGDPALCILDTAERRDADCICVAGRDRSPTGKAIFGSVTQDVIVGTQRPTLVCSADS